MKEGFDNNKYLKLQSEHIKKRISHFDNKLYMEFGGKLLDDMHASRVLPGFHSDSKLQMLLQFADQVEMVMVVSAEDIEHSKIREDLGKIRTMEQANSDAIATLQCESLSHIFAEYVEKGKPCPISVKQAVAAMYEEYTKDARHNHVAKDYLERLMSLPAE